MSTQPNSPQAPAARPARPTIDLEVIRTEQLTAHMVRLVLGGDGISAYNHNEFTDRYVKIRFPAVEDVRVRTYTVRHFDEAAGELWIDVVQHGDVGIGGPWAARAAAGDTLSLMGPGGAYRPDPDADWHLFVGDPAAYPAIASALEAIGSDAVVIAVLRAHDPDEATYLSLPDSAQVRWLFDGESLETTLQEIEAPSGVGHAFVHGELHEVRALRSLLVDRFGLTRETISLSGYWRRGLDEENFQAEKRTLT